MRNWDDAFNNMKQIDDSAGYVAAWHADSAVYRAHIKGEFNIAYGRHPREIYDLILPEGAPKGLAVFVHGGYWHKFGPNVFSHLAEGARAHGFAVCMAGYGLAPEVSIATMSRNIASAITHAAEQIDGPIYLAGHSAGGHLVSRMVSGDLLLADDVIKRVKHVLSISGLHDLRPILHLTMNEILQLTPESAVAESPALHWPHLPIPMTCWVGGKELPEFIRQSELLVTMWGGLGADINLVVDKARHHLDVIDGLGDKTAPITQSWLGL